MSSGTQISDMTASGTDFPDGAFVPFVVETSAGGLVSTTNYRYNAGLYLAKYSALAAVTGAALIGTEAGDSVQTALDDGAYPIKQNDGTVVATVDRANAYSGTGTATAGAPRFYVGKKTPIGDDSAMCVGRVVTGNLLFSHAFRDESEVTISGGGAYTSNDAFITIKTSTTKYNHSYGFQWRSIFQAANDIDLFAGFVSFPVVSGAGVTVDRLYHFHVQGLALSGGAVVSQHVGVYVSPLSGGTGTDYGLFIEANDAYIGGNLQIGGILNGVTSGIFQSQLTAKDFIATGGVTAFADGLSVTGSFGASSYGGLQAYSDIMGSTKGLTLQPSGGQVLIGNAGVPVSGAKLEVTGGDVSADGKVRATGGIGVGNSAAATTLGTVVKKMEVFDAAGASLGFVPIYNAIT